MSQMINLRFLTKPVRIVYILLPFYHIMEHLLNDIKSF